MPIDPEEREELNKLHSEINELKQSLLDFKKIIKQLSVANRIFNTEKILPQGK